MELKFATGEKINLARYMPGSIMLRGAQRETITFTVAESTLSYEKLKKLFTNQEATKTLGITNPHEVGAGGTSETTTQYTNYIVTYDPVIQPGREVVEQGAGEIDVFYIIMGKLTYVEEQLQKLGINPLGK